MTDTTNDVMDDLITLEAKKGSIFSGLGSITISAKVATGKTTSEGKTEFKNVPRGKVAFAVATLADFGIKSIKNKTDEDFLNGIIADSFAKMARNRYKVSADNSGLELANPELEMPVTFEELYADNREGGGGQEALANRQMFLKAFSEFMTRSKVAAASIATVLKYSREPKLLLDVKESRKDSVKKLLEAFLASASDELAAASEKTILAIVAQCDAESIEDELDLA